jgi:tRNA-dihydrouridine synthase 3
LVFNRYILSIDQPQALPDDDAAEGSSSYANAKPPSDMTQQQSGGLPGPFRNRMSKEQKKARRGQNKARRFGKVRDELELCWRVAAGKTCDFGST